VGEEDYTTNCVKITTGSNDANSGQISVKMQDNSGAITELLPQQLFNKNQVIFEDCLGDHSEILSFKIVIATVGVVQ